MRTFASSVVELAQPFDGTVASHPFECGWADEAIFFVSAHDPGPGVSAHLRVQLSADGIRWIDEGSSIDVPDDAFVRVRHFGGFLRLAGTVVDADARRASVTLSIRLALKG